MSTKHYLIALIYVFSLVGATRASNEPTLALPDSPKGALASEADLQQEADTVENPEAAPAPLVWWNRQITTFRTSADKMTPQGRTEDASTRLETSSDQWLTEEFSIIATEYETQNAIRFMVGETYLFAILEDDLDKLSGETLDQAAEEALEALKQIREARLKQRSTEYLLKSATRSVIATAIFLVAIVSLRWITRRLSAFVVKRVKHWRQLKVARADLRPHLATILEQVVKLPSFFLSLYLLCVWVAYVFNQFPRTEPLGNAFTGHLLGFGKSLALEVAAAIPGLLTAGIILFVARWIARIADQAISGLGDDSNKGVMAIDTAKATKRLAVAFIWLFAIVLAYPYIPGSGSDAFKGLSVLVGLMVSLGSSGLINQVMSGFVLLYSGSVRTGEYVKVGELEGTITEMGLLAVKLLNPAREFFVIPNAVMLSNPMTNFSRLSTDTGVPIKVSVTIGYDTPWRQVHELLTHSASAVDEVLDSPSPRVNQVALNDWYPEYTLICYISDPQQRAAVLSKINGNIQDSFNEAGVAIMSPHYNADTPEPLIIPKDRWFPPMTPASTKDN
ncbi:MAG: mechanosensitive ion channel family protein [Verrucomicrobiales bacterium]